MESRFQTQTDDISEMQFSLFIYGLTAVGPFASRAFSPLLMLALALRFGEQIPGLHITQFVNLAGGEATWFTNGWTISALGFLSLTEMLIARSARVREQWASISPWIKTTAATFAFWGIGAGFTSKANAQLAVADYIGMLVIASAAGCMCWLTVRISKLLEVVTEHELFGLRSTIQFLHDIWAIAGVLLVIVSPWLGLTLAALQVFLLFVFQAWLKRREQAAKVDCRCGAKMYSCALSCPECKSRNPSPNTVGMLGFATNRPVEDKGQHARALIAHKRCRECAERLHPRTVAQTCPLCQTPLFASREHADAFARYITSRVPLVLGATLLLGLVPVLGLIVGVVIYRLMIVTPFEQYSSRWSGVVWDWALWWFGAALALLQWIPFIGAFAPPLTGAAYFSVHRRRFQKNVNAVQQWP